MPNFIKPEYEDIESMLTPFIEEHELDKVTVNSLVRGSVEVIEPEVPIASLVLLDSHEMSGLSAKPQNIKVNLKFAINSIFSFKSIYEAESVWLVLTILKTIVFLISDMNVQLGKGEAIVLYALYRLQCANIERISDYIDTLKEKGEIVEEENVDIVNAISNLEKIKSIRLENGKYCLCETILISKA